MNITAYDLAMRCVQLKEVPGKAANPQIMAMLQLDGDWPKDDEVPWCSAFVNYICWWLRLPRSKRLNARSWLEVGTPIGLFDLEPRAPKIGWDVVILSRLNAGPEAGHVGFFAGLEVWPVNVIHVLGGNQSDTVSVVKFDTERVIGVRRLLSE